MSEDPGFVRRARAWLEEGPVHAPEAVLEAALFEIDSTPQARDLRVPWRHPTMAAVLRMAATAIAAVAITASAILIVRPGAAPAGVVGAPAPSSQPTAEATTSAAPSGSAAADANPLAAALTGAFTSTRYGYAVAVAPSWVTHPATLLWTGPDNSGDVVDEIDVPGTGSSFTGASQALSAGQTFAQWETVFQSPSLAENPCFGGPADRWPTQQVGSQTWSLQQMCQAAAAIAQVAGRVYVFTCVGCVSPADPEWAAFYRLLATVRFDPAAVPSPSPVQRLDATFTSQRNGFSVSYPAAWTKVRRATQAPPPNVLPYPQSPSYDAVGTDMLQLSVTSLPAASTGAWIAKFCDLAQDTWSQPCDSAPAAWQPLSIGKDPGWLVVDGDTAGDYPQQGTRLFLATAVVGGRAYEIRLDGPAEHDLFMALLASMRLDPAAAR